MDPVLDLHPSPLALLDPLGRILEVNQAWRASGKTSLGANFFVNGKSDFLKSLERSGNLDLHHELKAIVKGEKEHFETRHALSIGNENAQFQVQVRKLEEPSSGILFSCTQLPEREKASKIAPLELTDHLPVVALRFSSKRKGPCPVSYASAETQNLLGLAPDQLSSLDMLISMAFSKDRDRLEISLREAEANQTEWSEEFRITTAEGLVRWLKVNARPHPGSGSKTNWNGVLINITELKEVEFSLRNSESMFRSVAEFLSASIIVGKDNRIIYHNQALENLTGYTSKELTSMAQWELVHPDYQETVRNMKPGGDVRDETLRYELRAITKSGDIRWLDVSTRSIVMGGEPAFLVILIDITFRKKAEEAIRRSEVNFRTLAESIPAGILIAQEGKILFVNHELEKLTGYISDELKKKDFWDIVDPEHQNIVKSRGLALQQGENVLSSYEAKLTTKQNDTVWAEIRKEMVEFNGNKALMMVAIDITDRKIVEESLLRSENRYRKLVEHLPMAVLVHHKGKVIFANNEAARLVKVGHAGELMGQNVMDYVHPDYREMALERMKSLRANPSASAPRAEEKFICQDGTEIDVEVMGVPLEFYGRPSIQVIAYDITERKRREEELQQLSKELLHSNAELEKFAYITSHNLRAPVVNLVSLQELYNSDFPGDPDNPRILEKIKKSTRQLDATLNDLVKIVALKKEEDQPKDRIHFSDLAEVVKQSIESQIVEANIVIEENYSAAPSIVYHKRQLESILLNLMTNAIKYKSDKRFPKISISTEAVDDKICLKVEDNGIGIDLQKNGKKIFGLYQRFHHHIEGKGLGLYIVKSQVEALGGKIEVESEPDQGTTFKIYLKNFED